MNSTTYLHLQYVNYTQMEIKNVSGTECVNVYGDGSHLGVFMTPEQILQLHATLGAYIAEHHDKFVNKSITELEEVKND